MLQNTVDAMSSNCSAILKSSDITLIGDRWGGSGVGGSISTSIGEARSHVNVPGDSELGC